jgi:hypothetical protein
LVWVIRGTPKARSDHSQWLASAAGAALGKLAPVMCNYCNPTLNGTDNIKGLGERK